MLQLRSPSNLIKMLTASLAAATTAKVPTVTGTQAFIPMNTADAAAQNEYCYESEVSDAPKTTGEAWAIGQAIYWNASAGEFTTTSSGNTLCGHALATALSGDTTTPLFAFDSFAAV